jgi:hypothetical protein
MNFETKRFTFLILLITSMLILISGCSKDSSGPEEDPPTIPPQSTMIMDLSGFSTSSQAMSIPGSVDGTSETLTKNNWSWAATNVGVWSIYVGIVNVALSVPFTAFAATISEDPEYQGDATWLWEKTFPVLGIQHTAQLYGSLEGDNVIWEMYITKENVYSEFLWYRGVANVDATEGYWEFYKNPDSPTAYLRIDWHRTEDQKGDIKYTNADPSAPEYGSYIFYDLLDSGDFDAAFDMFSAPNYNNTMVEWHRTNRIGRVKDADHFGDDAWHCWDSMWEDVDCQ